MIVGDILDRDQLMEVIKGHDVVYHFAGMADIEDAKDQPLRAAELNIMGTLNTLEAARAANVKRFVFASTVYVYSHAGSFYRASKQSAEKFIETYHERYGMNYTILRYGSLYGQRAEHNNGIHRILKQALEEKEITYQGSPKAVREYIHVYDAARLSMKILDEQYANRHLVLTGAEKMAIDGLLHMVAEMVPHDVGINYSDNTLESHYELTPYKFQPKLGCKLIATDYVDLGQGLLDCMQTLYEEKIREDEANDEKVLV